MHRKPRISKRGRQPRRISLALGALGVFGAFAGRADPTCLERKLAWKAPKKAPKLSAPPPVAAHGSNTPLPGEVPVIQRTRSGVVALDWGKSREVVLRELRKNGFLVSRDELRPRLVVDGDRIIDLPIHGSKKKLDLGPSQEETFVNLEFVDSFGKIWHRSDTVLLENPDILAVAARSFEGRPTLRARLPASMQDIQPLLQEALETGRAKVVIVPRDPKKPGLPKLGSRHEVSARFDERGEIIGLVARHRIDNRIVALDPNDWFVKVDAAFNGNAFVWDDALTALGTISDDPRLARATLDFWYTIQDLYGTGVIPREVSKKTLRSFNPYERIRFGVRTPNPDYTNPYLFNWTESVLYAHAAPGAGAGNLRKSIDSMRKYLAWFEKERAVLDTRGNPIDGAYWTSNLGSGMDNSPRSHTNAHPERFASSAWVDMAAQRIAMYKDMARMHWQLGEAVQAEALLPKISRMESKFNELHWSPKEGFYFDRVKSPSTGEFALDDENATIAGFWALFADSASPSQVATVVEKWLTDKRFGGKFPFPSLSRDHPSYSAQGDYWMGGRWPSMAGAALESLERAGRPDLAHEFSIRFLKGMAEASEGFKAEHGRNTFFEFMGVKVERNALNELVERAISGIKEGHVTRIDFTGWGKLPAVYDMTRHAVGLRPVGGYAGPAKGLASWARALESSPLFKNTNFFRFNPQKASTAQRALASEGFLEWNLFGDLPLSLHNYRYQGQLIEELSIARRDDGAFVLKVKSEKPFQIQLNRLFELEGGQTRKASAPIEASPLLKVGGGRAEVVWSPRS